MILVRRLLLFLASLLMIGMVVLTFSGAGPNTQIGAEPSFSANNRIRLDHGFVVLKQDTLLPTPQPTELTLRMWVQQLPSYYPFLTVQGTLGPSRIGPIDVSLPPPDGKFHMIELPWWRVPVNAERMNVKLTGHGVLVGTTTPSDIRPGLEVNGVARPEQSLALQMVGRQASFEHYVPLLQIAEGKPGLLGYPRLLLLLSAALFATWGILISVAPRLMRDVLQAHVAKRTNTDQQ